MIDIEIQISISKRSSGWEINYNPPLPPQVTPLWLACWIGSETDNWDVALWLLSKGANPNKAAKLVSKDGVSQFNQVQTPLYWAVDGNSTEVVRSLLANGARQDLNSGGGEIVSSYFIIIIVSHISAI